MDGGAGLGGDAEVELRSQKVNAIVKVCDGLLVLTEVRTGAPENLPFTMATD
jgi:hypothetical protein